jgi:exopolyphosphatase/guanosine-5'-triphosphate,3'-diphosphate pyrophosphatase
MSYARRAVIDVGTNSVKLLVADVSGREVRPLCEDSQQTRLGQGFYETHRLQPEAIARTARAVARFLQDAQSLKAGSVRVIATSAARDAVNPQDLLTAIENAAGLKAEIVSGEQEADWVFQGVTTDPSLADRPLFLLDVGGGSSEFILGRGNHTSCRQSFRLGTVRLLETIPPDDPPTRAGLTETRRWLREFIQAKIHPVLQSALPRSTASPAVELVGTGGTATILARMESKLENYDRERIESTRLSLDRTRWHTEHLWSLPLARRQEVVGLPTKRADVILAGAVIYEAVMESFGFPELRVSTRGLRFAALMDCPSEPD